MDEARQKELAELNRQIGAQPDSAERYIKRGDFWREQKEYERAVEDYSIAIKREPSSTNAYNKRGNARYKLGDYDKAMEDYNRVIALDPNYAFAYYNRGILFNDLKQFEQAIASYTRAIELNPNYTSAFNNRGVTWKNMGSYKNALADFSKALELKPNYALARKNRGKLYAVLKDYSHALDDYKSALVLYEADGATSMVGSLQKWIAEMEATIREAETRLQQIDQLMTDPTMAEIERQMQENRASFNTFIEEQPPRRVPVPQFHMLRRWNSYTPIIAKNPFVSKGGRVLSGHRDPRHRHRPRLQLHRQLPAGRVPLQRHRHHPHYPRPQRPHHRSGIHLYPAL